MTEIISVGLPPIGSISISTGEVSSVSLFKGRLETRQIHLDILKHKDHAILVSFLKAVDEGAELDCPWGSLLIQPLSKRQRKLVKRRGWVQLVTSRLEGYSTPSISCYYLIREGKADCMVMYARPDTAGFMSRLSDDVTIADLALPGTHDTCAYYGFLISQCQQRSTPLSQQLLDGVRYLDIRCQVIRGELQVYHGDWNQGSTFQQVLTGLVAFLQSHPTETVIMSVKDEVRHEDFSRLVWLDMAKYDGMWFLENRVPTLGEVRGKAILLTRFWASPDDDNWERGRGWQISGWAAPTKNHQFEIAGTKGRLQDWYTLSSFLEIPEKMAIVEDSLLPEPNDGPKDSELVISFASASGFPLSPPSIIAKGFGWPAWHLGIEGINSRLQGWLLRQLAHGRKVKGIVPMDFYRQTGINGEDGSVRELLVLMNDL